MQRLAALLSLRYSSVSPVFCISVWTSTHRRMNSSAVSASGEGEVDALGLTGAEVPADTLGEGVGPSPSP